MVSFDIRNSVSSILGREIINHQSDLIICLKENYFLHKFFFGNKIFDHIFYITHIKNIPLKKSASKLFAKKINTFIKSGISDDLRCVNRSFI